MQLLSGKVLARLKSLHGQTNNTAGIIILPAGSAAANMTLLAIAAYIMHQQDTDTKKSHGKDLARASRTGTPGRQQDPARTKKITAEREKPVSGNRRSNNRSKDQQREAHARTLPPPHREQPREGRVRRQQIAEAAASSSRYQWEGE